jgi:hypothetical protein
MSSPIYETNIIIDLINSGVPFFYKTNNGPIKEIKGTNSIHNLGNKLNDGDEFIEINHDDGTKFSIDKGLLILDDEKKKYLNIFTYSEDKKKVNEKKIEIRDNGFFENNTQYFFFKNNPSGGSRTRRRRRSKRRLRRRRSNRR